MLSTEKVPSLLLELLWWYLYVYFITSINKSSSTHLYFYDLWGLSTDI